MNTDRWTQTNLHDHRIFGHANEQSDVGHHITGEIIQWLNRSSKMTEDFTVERLKILARRIRKETIVNLIDEITQMTII